MATFYVDPDSVTNGVGSESDPFNTWASVTWTAGHTYLQKRGTTHSGTITVGVSGTAGSRVTIGAYGAGARPIVQGLAAEHGINLGTRAYVSVVSMHAIAGSNASRNGVNGLATDALTAHYIEIRDCVIESPTSAAGVGVQLRGKGDVIAFSEIKNCVNDGLFLTVSNCTLDHLYIHDFDLTGGGDGDGIQFAGTHDHGKTLLNEVRVIGQVATPVKQCVITAAGTGAFWVRGGEYYGMVTGLSLAIAGALVEGARIHGGTQRGITCAGDNIVIQNCAIYNTPRGVSLDAVTGVVLQANNIQASVEGVTATSGSPSYSGSKNAIDAPLVHAVSVSAVLELTDNVYRAGSDFSVGATTYDLAAWKAALSTDLLSVETLPLGLSGTPVAAVGISAPFQGLASGISA